LDINQQKIPQFLIKYALIVHKNANFCVGRLYWLNTAGDLPDLNYK